MKEKPFQHVYIVGSKGIPAAYGGFETFVEALVTGKQTKEIRYHVACMDNETFEDGLTFPGVCLFHVRVPAIGAARAVLYDLRALDYCINDIKENRLINPIIYVLACRVGPFIAPYKREIEELGGKLYVNPDGQEYKRAKWNRAIRVYWKHSEKGMVRNADLLICDSVTIEDILRKTYAQFHPRTIYLSYGAHVEGAGENAQPVGEGMESAGERMKSARKRMVPAGEDVETKLSEWYATHGITKGDYYLIVGRFVPENNYETMLREYIASGSKRDLVIITNVEKNGFYRALAASTLFAEHPGVKFVGTVYDQALLAAIRRHAYAYLHGHEVGGTNPSLLEALAATDMNLLMDVGFNREVADEAAWYFTKEQGNLAELIRKADACTPEERQAMGEAARARIKGAFSWEKIIADYERLFYNGSITEEMVSVCMTTYNGARFVREQIDSILGQLGDADELVISDDGSTDGTWEILAEVADRDARVRILHGPGRGVIANFNHVLAQSAVAHGRRKGVIFLADQDDVWYPDKVRRVLKHLHETDADLVLHDVRVTDENLEATIYPSFFAYRRSKTGFTANLIKNSYMGCAMAFRGEILEDVLPAPETLPMHDWWIGTRAARAGKGAVLLPEVLMDYRRHADTASDFGHNTLGVMIRNRWQFLKEHYRRDRRKN